MTMLTENVVISDENVRGFFVTPRVPQGLAAAVESLTREVIRQRPKDIYMFAAQHFENLLRQREYCHYDKNHCGKIKMMFECPDENEWSRDRVVKVTKQYDKSMMREGSMMALYRQHDKQKSIIANVDKTICPKITRGIQIGTDFKTESKKSVIPELSNKIMINSNIDKIKKRVVNKFATAKSLNELQELNYVNEVQDVIDNTTRPVLNKKLEILKKTSTISNDNFEARLNETRNLLQDISSCFPPKKDGSHRPHSADSAAQYDKRFVTEKLQIMLSETHDLLVDISTNFINTSHSDGANATKNCNKNNINIPSTLPAVCSPSLPINSIAQNNGSVGNNKNISQILALPPVMINSTIKTAPTLERAVKIEQDLTLPLLSLPTENGSERVNNYITNGDSHESTKEIKNDDNIQSPKSIAELNVNPCEITIKSAEVSSNYDRIDTMTTNITPIIDDNDKQDPSLNLFGEMVDDTASTATKKSSGPLENVMESLVDDLSSISSMMDQVVKLHQHADLDCINEEEDPIEEYFCVNEKDNVESEKLMESESQIDPNMEQRDESEVSSSVKETSVTDGLIVGSTTNIEHSGTGNDGSVSTQMCESSNEAKETTLTDGISLSLDEPMRPFIPELNLDSLQDITVSSFKMTEDEQYDDNTNSIVETPTSSYHNNQNDAIVSGTDEYSFQNVELEPLKKMVENDCGIESNQGEIDTPIGDISRSESRCTTRRVNSGNLTWPRESKSSIGTTKHWEEMEVVSNDENGFETDEMDQTNLIAAVNKIQAGIRGFLVRRRRQHLKPTLDENDSNATDAVVRADNNEDIQIEVEKSEDFRGQHVGKRLCRENAITHRTTTLSTEDEEYHAVMKSNGLQHTGEFHDWIVLPLHDYHTPAINNECNLIKKTNPPTIINIVDKINCSEVSIIAPSVENDNTENLIKHGKLHSDNMKYLSRLPIFHFGMNKNISNVAIDHFILLSNNEMMLVQDDNQNTRLELSTSPLKSGMIIEEIIDTPSDIQQTQLYEVTETLSKPQLIEISNDSETQSDATIESAVETTKLVTIELDSNNSFSISKGADSSSSSSSLLLASTEKVIESIIIDEEKNTDSKKDNDL
ncbi:hypothetical protein PV325_000793 [Microctonus aethiopoides]|nr:hypothetical protein PV325_000793 [Microctonus aethiopoides]